MPFHLEAGPRAGTAWVVTTDSGRRHSKAALPLRRARAQLRLLASTLLHGGVGDDARDAVRPYTPAQRRVVSAYVAARAEERAAERQLARASASLDAAWLAQPVGRPGAPGYANAEHQARVAAAEAQFRAVERLHAQRQRAAVTLSRAVENVATAATAPRPPGAAGPLPSAADARRWLARAHAARLATDPLRRGDARLDDDVLHEVEGFLRGRGGDADDAVAAYIARPSLRE